MPDWVALLAAEYDRRGRTEPTYYNTPYGKQVAGKGAEISLSAVRGLNEARLLQEEISQDSGLIFWQRVDHEDPSKSLSP